MDYQCQPYEKSLYDIIIVGAGPSGIFTAYKLITERPELNILMLEKGESIRKRNCPKRKTGVCANCKNCAVLSGFAGAGAWSDGKLVLASSDVGGSFFELIGEDKLKELLHEMDDIYLKFGATETLYGVNEKEVIDSIRKSAIKANMRLVDNPIRHLGTDGSPKVYTAIEDYLIKSGVTIKFNSKVSNLIVHREVTQIIDRSHVSGVVLEDGTQYFAKKVIVGAGRDGSSWFKDICDEHNVEASPGVVDIGVRVECRNEIMSKLNKLYESKLIYYTKTYCDEVRTFCQNPGGEVTLENYNIKGDHIVTVNGHAYSDEDKKTDNTNFALLVTLKFTEPFKNPLEYGAYYAKLANMLAGGKAMVQTYGDIKRKRRSTPDRLRHGNVRPTLKEAEAGDLSLVLPHRIMTDLVEMIEALDKIVPGLANDETLLYGVEVKFYSNKVNISKSCETSIQNLYAIGDSSSWSHGLSIASCMGLHVASEILKNS